MDLTFNTPNYHVDIMKISNYKFELTITHKPTQEERVYSVDEEIKSVSFDGLELRMNIALSNGTYIHFNFESEEHITADIYENHTEEHLDTFANHSFYE